LEFGFGGGFGGGNGRVNICLSCSVSRLGVNGRKRSDEFLMRDIATFVCVNKFEEHLVRVGDLVFLPFAIGTG